MMDLTDFPLLAKIDSPAQLRSLTQSELPALAKELREYLLRSLNISGGHFGSNLGTVELAIALHYVFDTPNDTLLWDVGHQAYPHKVLTGRRDALTTIRQTDGLSPFPKREESPYDSFGVGHSSTSISAALGMALANKQLNDPSRTVAIIGDGAMTAGMAFEALNHAGEEHADMLVILNDNDMSISRNVGALSNYLTKVLSGKVYSTMREGSKRVLKRMPPMWELAKRTEQHMKGMIVPGTLFEELGFYYLGPVDGHDLPNLVKTLQNLRAQRGPKLLHIATTKGKGYAPAEADPIRYHAVKPGYYDPPTAATKTAASPAIKKPTYSQVFGDWLCRAAEKDERVIGITPAMGEGSSMIEFSERFPDRYFDVGIAEQHSVTFAAGLACRGLRPVVAIYSTFLQRAYDQLIHDVAIQNLPVLFAIDRAGLVGGDGTTHHGTFDLSYLRCIPNIIVMAPSDEEECQRMLSTGLNFEGPSAVRYPRGTGPGVSLSSDAEPIEIGKAKMRREGETIALLAFGALLQPALEAAETLDATVIDMRFIKPLDREAVLEAARRHTLLVTLEENVVAGGAGSAVNECLQAEGLRCNVLNLGLPDRFVEHGDPDTLLARCHLTTEGIVQAVQVRLGAAVVPLES